MSNTVEVILSTKDAQTVRAWQNYKNNVAAVDAQMAKIDATQKKNAVSAKEYYEACNWGEMIGGATATMGAIGGIGGAISTAVSYQQQLSEELEKTAEQMDELNRKYQVQAGLTSAQGAVANSKILDIAEKNGISVTDAHNLTRQLVSSGYDKPEETGTADAMAKILASSNLDASKGEDMAKAMGQFLVGFGQDKNASNLLDLGVRTRGLFKSTDVQLGDLSEFAKAAPSFKTAGVSMQDTLSALGILREAEAPGEAATHGRNVVGLMTTFGSEKKKVDTLKKRGLTPKDLDLVGETLPEALAKLRDSTEGMSTAEKSAFMKDLFGQENIAGATILVENAAKFQKFGEFQQDKKGFEEGVRTNQSGFAASQNRIEAQSIRERQKYAEKALNDKLLRQEFARNDEELALDAKSMGLAGWFLSSGTGVKSRLRDAALWSGFVNPADIASPENLQNVERAKRSEFSIDRMQREIAPAVPGAAPRTPQPAAGGDITKAIHEQTAAIRELVTSNRPQVSVMMPGGAAPARPVAAASIGRRPQ